MNTLKLIIYYEASDNHLVEHAINDQFVQNILEENIYSETLIVLIVISLLINQTFHAFAIHWLFENDKRFKIKKNTLILNSSEFLKYIKSIK